MASAPKHRWLKLGPGALLSVAGLFLISGALFYAVMLYTVFFKQRRDHVGYLMILSWASAFVGVYCLSTRATVALQAVLREDQRVMELNEKKRQTFMYRNFHVHGKHFFETLHLMEMVETVYQCINLVSLYSCTFRRPTLVVLMALFFVDAAGKALLHQRIAEVKVRDKRTLQLLGDICVDAVSVAAPVAVLWFVERVPIEPGQFLQIVFVPVVSIVAKLYATFTDSVVRNALSRYGRALVREVRPTQKRPKSSYDRVLDAQKEAVGAGFNSFFLAFQAFFALVFAALLVQFALRQDGAGCHPVLWEGCALKAPFCRSLLAATCNCAVLDVRGHNFTRFPREMLAMDALRKARVRHGPLQHLDPGLFEGLPHLRILDVEYNRIRDVPRSFGKANVQDLRLSNNLLETVPDEVYGNKHTRLLFLDNNNISSVSKSVRAAASLRYFSISNNSVASLPKELFSPTSHIIRVDGNRLRRLPDVGGASALWWLWINNNNVAELPESVAKLLRLEELDARHNPLAALPPALGDLPALKRVYVDGTPVCADGRWGEQAWERRVEGGCTAQCSRYCQDKFLGDKQCIAECNSEACAYDGGDCLPA